MSQLFSLKNRVVLLTGSSDGLGFAMARAMADAGALVVLNARGRDKLDRAARSLRDAGLEADTEPFDVADEAALVAGVRAVVGRHGRIDVLVGNAGVQHRVPLGEFTTEDFQRVVNVDLTA